MVRNLALADVQQVEDEYATLFRIRIGRTVAADVTCEVCVSVCLIHSLYVQGRFRRRGYATRLLERVRQYASRARCTCLELRCHANNTAALAAYRKFGFVALDPHAKPYLTLQCTLQHG